MTPHRPPIEEKSFNTHGLYLQALLTKFPFQAAIKPGELEQPCGERSD